ncbi:MAG: glycosyltransferase family 4 protein [Sphingobacterium sp.]
MENRILVLGYFGYVTEQLDGQTIKTRNLFQLLKNKGQDVDYFDTQVFKVSKLSIFKLIKKLIWSTKVYYLPAQNNLKYIFPVLFVLSKFFSFNIFYFVVGGWLTEFLKDKRIHISLLRRIKLILVETNQLKVELSSEFQIEKVILFPNFKFQIDSPVRKRDENKIRLVFLSRINRKKGLDFLFSLSDRLVNVDNVEIFCYGPVNDEDKVYFYSQLKTHTNLTYGGTVPFTDVVNVLSTFDVFIFPTKYFTEGLPGVIIEAYFAGIPVVATRWKYAQEFIDDGKSGLLVEWDNFEDFLDKIQLLIDNPVLLNQMKESAKIYGRNYSEEKGWELLESIQNL